MKLTKLFIIFFILMLYFASCKKTTVTITKPGEEISLINILGEIKDVTYDGLEITGNGNSIKVGNGTNETNYTKGEDIGGIVGVYTNANDTNNMLVIQGAGTTITLPANEDGTKALKEAFENLGKDKVNSYILKAMELEDKNKKSDGTNTIDIEKELLKGATDKEKTELEKIIKNGNIDFSKYKMYGNLKI